MPHLPRLHTSQNGVPDFWALTNACAAGLNLAGLGGGGVLGAAAFAGAAAICPGLAVTASRGAVGDVGVQPDPEPAAPPELIITIVPLMNTPPGLMLMKFPPTFSVSDV